MTKSGRRPRQKSFARDAARPPGLALRSKVAQLADYLRNSITEGTLVEPVPGTRGWSKQLGVSRRTLNAVVAELRADGWLTVHRRGVRVNPAGRRAQRRSNAPRLVRMLLFAAYRGRIHNYLETISGLDAQLRQRGLELRWEICASVRLREIARQPSAARELLLLASVLPAYQRLFQDAGKPACVLGEVAAGISLPFVNVDQASAVRHAAFRMLQHGCRQLVLVHINVEAAGIRSARTAFADACAAWPHQPVTARVMPTALDHSSLSTTVRRLAEKSAGRKGIIVIAPVPVGMVVTALLYHGVAVPAQAEVVALFHSPEAVSLYPAPVFYPYPVEKVVRQLARVAEHFFTTGHVPPIHVTIPVEPAR
ncbi:MAG: hypothetical protein JWM88_463 [Verrucomicrobia bacterium]|nr:hypothetical protein [Verrucomicrobiota bacterium]